jgi:hypothetical protein
MLTFGDSFMLAKPGCSTEHLWVLVCAPDRVGDAIMVNVTTQRSNSETTTVLQPGEHPFIVHPSVVFYADARIVDVQQLRLAIESGVARPYPRFSAGVLKRIQHGLTVSRFTPRKIKAAFSEATEQGRI